MLTKPILIAALSLFALTSCSTISERLEPPSPARGKSAPKLVLVVMIDGLPMEQLYKNQDLFVANGFRRFLDRGAVFTDAHQAHAFTLTAPGHAAVATGAFPYQHGIIGNEWRDRAGKYVYNTQDPAHKYLDGTPTTDDDGVSPKNLRVSTFGDELGYSNSYASRVYTVAIKDRGAILLGGKTGKAFMYSTQSGQFTSTSYYMPSHPKWWGDFYSAKPQDKFFQQRWNTLLEPGAYARSLPDNQPWSSTVRNMSAGMGYLYGIGEEKPGRNYYNTLHIGPFGNEILADFALSMMKGEQLGRNPKGAPDVIGLSFSSHDYINHGFGPESVQSQDHLIRLDRTLARMFDEMDAYAGRGNVLSVLTADHGFVNAPETNASRGFEASRLDALDLRNKVNAIAERKFGIAKLATQHMTGGWTLDYAAMDEKKLDRAEVETFLARTVLEQPGIAYAFTRSQLERGQLPDHRVGKLTQRAWNQSMAIDLVIIPKPYHFFASRPQSGNPTACTHGSPFKYDTHVPLMMHGDAWVRPGAHAGYAEVTDIAPTLASLLRTQFPSGSEGRVLSEGLR